MAWIILTAANVATKLAGAELTAVRSAALAAGQADPLPVVLSAVISQALSYVAARYPIGVGDKIPEEIETAVCNLTAWELVSRLPVKSLATEAREGAKKDALAYLRDIAAGRAKLIPLPALDQAPAAEQPAAPPAKFWRRPAPI